MRVFDWSTTDLGSPDAWPDNLRVATSICLTSRFPIVIWWGPNLTLLYNDAYIPFLGPAKHPRYLGQSGRECWADIWTTIGPMLESVQSTKKATWSEDLLFFFDRKLPREEVYVTLSFGPILSSDGQAVNGIFCVCTETTERVTAARRLETLRRLATPLSEARLPSDARSPSAACESAAEVLADDPWDIPFAAIYLLDDAGTEAHYTAGAGVSEYRQYFPEVISLNDTSPSMWPLGRVSRTLRAEDVPDLRSTVGAIPGRAWHEPPSVARVLPLIAGAHEEPLGLLIVGIGPRRVFDANYRAFLDLASGHLATALGEARAYSEERDRANTLAELDRAKTAFFSNVSHEFRTPLQLMLGPLEDLLATPLDPAQHEQVDLIFRNGLRLLKLVNSLLDFARIEAGRIEAVYMPTDLCALTSELASGFNSAMERAGLSFVVECERNAEPAFVDREMWEKIVFNLLSNAIKFTHQGHVVVRVLRQESDFVLTVSDTGIGIPRAALGHVFERFHRVRGAQGRSFEGTGIGLALVQELTRLHGGAVCVKSKEGQGSIFTVRIPRGAAHLPKDRIGSTRTQSSTGLSAAPYLAEALHLGPENVIAEPRGIPPPRASSTGGTILVVDDNQDLRDYVSRLLSPFWSVETATDGEVALRVIERHLPDLVLTDAMMPILDGVGLLRRLRANDRTRTLPVILLSARAGEESQVEGLGEGADDYLVKPFSARELLARVSSHVEMAHVRAEAARKEREANERLREADRRKDEFLAMLAHELRNPLAAILNAVTVLSQVGYTDEPSFRMRNVIGRQAKHLARLVDDLLDVSRITRGTITLKMAQVPLKDVVDAAVETGQAAADQLGHSLSVSLPGHPVLMTGDFARLVQIVSNLLSNAVKFSPAGGRIRIVAEPGDREVAIHVRDSGMGLAHDLLPRVFDLFVQEE